MKQQRILPMVTLALLGINLMLASLILGSKAIPIKHAVPSLAESKEPQLQIEYGMEQTGQNQMTAQQEDGKGSWRVEHYQEYEYHYDHQGRLLEKRPTSHQEHVRYWMDH